MSSRRRNPRRSARPGRQRRQPVAEADDEQQQVVDLTCDDYQYVDLTHGSPVILPDTPAAGPMTRTEDSLRSPYVVSDGSISDDDLPPVPFKITAKPRIKPPTNSPQTGDGRTSTTPKAMCPVCLDSFSEVKASGRQVMSTTCGHVFCGECLNGVLNENATGRKCPTCRKKLSARTVHPLFI